MLTEDTAKSMAHIINHNPWIDEWAILSGGNGEYRIVITKAHTDEECIIEDLDSFTRFLVSKGYGKAKV